MSAPSDQRGFALLLVLSVAAVLALLGSQIAAAGRTEALIARNLADRAAMERAADGGVRLAIFHLLGPPEQAWPADGARRMVVVRGIAVSLRIEGQRLGVNPNTATAMELATLLTSAGVDGVAAPGIAFAIVGQRERTSAGRATAFTSAADLAKVPGVTAAIAQRLALLLAFPTAQQTAQPGGAARLTITAAAEDQGGTRAARRATVSLNPADPRRPFRILTWDVPGG